MKQQCDEPSVYIPKEKWYDIKVQGDYVVSGKELTCRNLIVDGNFVLIGNLFCNDIDIKGDCIIYGNIFSCRKVNVQGDLCILKILKSDYMEGGFLGTHGDIEVGGNLIAMYRIRAGAYEIKVGGDVITGDVECKTISIAGDCTTYPSTVTVYPDENIYVLGNVKTGFAVEAKKVFCGGKYTRQFYCEEESTKIYENFIHWSMLT